MSIKIDQLQYQDPPDYSWLPDRTEVTDSVAEIDVLALIRQILRERSDCDMIPLIKGVVYTGSANQYGHNLFISVQYAKRGYSATYGAKTDTTVHSLQCYMD